MKKKTKRKIRPGYKDDFYDVQMSDLVTMKDTRLPSPAEIAQSLLNARICIVLDKAVIDFFKEQAKQNSVGYQQMIRYVLRRYMEDMKKAA